MTPQEFILTNVKKELLKLGYDENIALSGADEALGHYRRCSQASRKGRIFDDCLYVAKTWAQKIQPKKK
ncbi:TPA: hypothetical protein MIH07_13055 [Klebsiella pneumoniae]|nr:hypothetical protein [Klebsiella pneumoniae]